MAFGSYKRRSDGADGSDGTCDVGGPKRKFMPWMADLPKTAPAITVTITRNPCWVCGAESGVIGDGHGVWLFICPACGWEHMVEGR